MAPYTLTSDWTRPVISCSISARLSVFTALSMCLHETVFVEVSCGMVLMVWFSFRESHVG